MSQHDYDLANAAGGAYRVDANSALQALATLSSGASSPATIYAYQWWADTTTGLLNIRNAANSAWITVGTLATTGLGLSFPSGTRMLFQQTAAPTGWTKESNATYNDAAPRFTTGTVGTGGADAFNTLFGTSKSTAGFTLTNAEIPSHTHAAMQWEQDFGMTGGGSVFGVGVQTQATSGATGGGGSHSHTLNNMNLKFVDCIVAQMN